MKNIKIILISTLLLVPSTLYAQTISKNALGVRVGDNYGFGGEISYQHYLSDSNRIEFDLDITLGIIPILIN